MNSPSPREQRRLALMDALRREAQAQFSERGFEDTGIRDIASAVGVNPAIVIRHFGSKEALFLATMSLDSKMLAVLDGPLANAGRAVVSTLLDSGDAGWKVYAALIRASGRPEVNALLRESFEQQISARLLPRLTGDDAPARIYLFTAQLVGLLTMFAVYGEPASVGATRDMTVTIYGDAMQSVLTPRG